MKRPPNIVMIVLDSVRRDHLGCYGHPRSTTPNIDRLAQEGIRFRHAYAASCWTIPAHASLFTGLYPSDHRADLGTRRLSPRRPTLAEALHRRGYRTACVTCNGFISARTGLNRGFDVTVDADGIGSTGPGMARRLARGLARRWRARTARDRGARRATREACRWLAEHHGVRPFFLFVNYMDCHLPYRLHARELHRFVPPGARRRAGRVPQDPFAAMAGAVTLTSLELDMLRDLYDGALHYLDEHVGRLAATLARLGLDDHTVLVITSDHGESFGEHGLLDHQYGLYENLIAVPLVLRLPGAERAGTVHDALVQHIDLYPTLLARAGAARGADDEPARDIFAARPRDAVVAEYLVPNLRAIRRRFPGADVSHLDVALRSIRVGQDKLIRRGDGRDELYDLGVDPDERWNIITQRPEAADRLQRRLASIVGDAFPAGEASDDAGAAAEVRERLEALGYL